jgi:mRNA-degrading endonuclease YafQ of YafQ-DinJ toxin-antitoxin module
MTTFISKETISRLLNDVKQIIKNPLNENGIYYDDIILYTQRKLGKLKPSNNLGYTYEDVNLLHICPDVNLIYRVLTNQELRVICFTNGMSFRTGGLIISDSGLVDAKNSDALSLFLRACQNIGLKIEMQCMPYFDWTVLGNLTDIQKRTKLIFALRFTKTNQFNNPLFVNFEQKIITILTPFSPAAHGKIESHPIVISLKQHYGANFSAPKLLPKIYEKFRNNTYQDLYQYNINN